MGTNFQEKLGDYLKSPKVKETLDRLVGLCSCCVRIYDHEKHLIFGSTSSIHSCALLTANDRADVSVPPDCRCEPGLTTIDLPLNIQDENLGTLICCAKGTVSQVETTSRRLLRLLIDTVQSEYDLDNLSSEILAKYEELNVLYDVGETLSITMDHEEMCRVAQEKVQHVVGAEQISIYFFDGPSCTLDEVVGEESSAHENHSDFLETMKMIHTTVAVSGKPMLLDRDTGIPPEISDKLSEMGCLPTLKGPLLSSPMKKGDEVIGVISVSEKPGRAVFTANDLKLVMAIGSQAAVTMKNIQMIKQLRETEALRREVEIARNIQRNFLPTGKLKCRDTIVTGRCTTAAKVGGDYFDHIFIEGNGGSSEGIVHLLIADVSGHDVAAALLMSVVRKVFHSEIICRKSPAEVLKSINRLMLDDLSQSGLFITMFYAQYEPNGRKVRYSNAGHNPPFLVRRHGEDVSSLDTDGIIVGVFDDAEFEERDLSLEEDDLILFYTDGVVERENPDEDQFGLSRLHDFVQRNRGLSPEEILDGIYTAVDEFAVGKPQDDDITVMVLKSIPGLS